MYKHAKISKYMSWKNMLQNNANSMFPFTLKSFISVFICVHAHINAWAKFCKNTRLPVNCGVPLEGSGNERGSLGTKMTFTIYFIC